jgi:hypothetical protein
VVRGLGSVGRRFAVAVWVLAGVALGLPAGASADAVGIVVQTGTPEQGVPLTINFSGADPSIQNGGYLYAVVRPAGGINCQSSYGSDQAVASSVSTDLFNGADSVSPGAFTAQTTFDPASPGGYLVCAWVEDSAYDSSGDPATPSQVTAATQNGFIARGPQVEQLTVSLPAPPQPGVAYQIAYTTQTDQELSLYSVVKPAGGLPCASSYELEQQQNEESNDVFGGASSVFGGPSTLTATDTEPAGSYLVCTWVEGPTPGEVDAALTTPISVGQVWHPVTLTSATELAAFRHWIASRYPTAHGYEACPSAQIFSGQGSCLGEVRVGRRWHQIGAAASVQHGAVALHYLRDTSWVRRFSRYGRHVIAGVGAPGTASVNSPDYDWAWLAAGAHAGWIGHRRTFSVDAYDGDSAGFGRLFMFHCRVRGATITCTNALGDAMRYRPRG